MPPSHSSPGSAEAADARWREERLRKARLLSFDGQDEAVLRLLEDGFDAPHGPHAASHDAALALRAIGLRAQSLMRLGRHQAAIRAYLEAPPRLDGVGIVEARALLLEGLAFAYAHLDLSERALAMATAAFRLALAGAHYAVASQALDCVGVCHALRGDHGQAEHFMLQALGLALQRADELSVHRRLSNLIYHAQVRYDDALAAGDEMASARYLTQCARFATQGDRLMRRAGAHEQCLWRSNRAGWLQRRGLLTEAIAEYDAVCNDASRHGWVLLRRNARLDQALALRERGRRVDALATLSELVADDSPDDSYDVRLRAHELLHEMHANGGRHDEAAHHAAEAERLAGARLGARDALKELLPQLDQAIDAAIADADRLRTDVQAERQREQVASERSQRFLDTGC